MVRKKYIRRKIEKKYSSEEWSSDVIAELKAAMTYYQDKKFKYIRVGITSDLKQSYDTHRLEDSICWSKMVVKFKTDNYMDIQRIISDVTALDEWAGDKVYFPATIFDEQTSYFVYILVGRRLKSKLQLNKKTYTFIDLFAGCGGLSEGFYKQGFKALAHVEMDHICCETLKSRMAYYKYKDIEKAVIEQDITSEDILERIEEATDCVKPDIIIGGPSCQAYTQLGRVRNKEGVESDPRNFLFESYVRILEKLEPKFFVFEHVTGLLTAKVNNKPILPMVLDALGNKYKIIRDPQMLLLNSVNYGVPQLRKSLIIMGVHKSIEEKDAKDLYDAVIQTHYNPEMSLAERGSLKRWVSVADALYDLPPVLPGEDASCPKFEYPCNNAFLKWVGKPGKYPLYDHISRNHNAKDRERFKAMIENHWTFGTMRMNRPDLEHEHARVFGNSYVVQWEDLPSKTIIAHLAKDGFQFIHPDVNQLRTFTVREAARIQSFPDDFQFAGSRSDKYKQIGNAVPPLFAEALAKAIRKNLEDLEVE